MSCHGYCSPLGVITAVVAVAVVTVLHRIGGGVMTFEWRSCVVVTLCFFIALSVVIPCTNGPLGVQSVAPHTRQPETHFGMIGTSSRAHRDHVTSMQADAENVRFLSPRNQ